VLLLVPGIPVLLILFLLGMEQAEAAWLHRCPVTNRVGRPDDERRPASRPADIAPLEAA